MKMQHWIKPIELIGEHVVLKPLAAHHCEPLQEAVVDGELWSLWYTKIQHQIKWRQRLRGGLPCKRVAECCLFILKHAQQGKHWA